MFTLAAVMFGVTALGGITAATLHLRHTPPPLWLGRVHGAAALASIIVLAIGVGQKAQSNWAEASYATGALTMFFVAAVMGRILFIFHARKGVVPKVMIVLHATAAVTGLALLLFEIASDVA